LRRTEDLATVRLPRSILYPPILRPKGSRPSIKAKVPIVDIVDDGDIPPAYPTEKPDEKKP
jgi:hypothetical protein